VQTKAFAIIAAASLAISLGAGASFGGNSQDDPEGQGKAVCRQSLLKLDQLTVETGPAAQTLTSFRLRGKDWREMSLTEKRLYVRALGTLVAAQTEGFEIMTLRNVNGCPQHSAEKPYANQTEESIRKLEDILVREQLRLALEQTKSLD
jgi:hypothetical protein